MHLDNSEKNDRTCQCDNTITVYGSGHVDAPPDIAKAIIGVETTSEKISEAQRKNAMNISTIVTTLRKMGIKSENIQTVEYRVDEDYSFENNTKVFLGYKVTHRLSVVIEPVQKTGEILDAAVSSGANIISGISFEVKQPNKYYNKALTKAIVEGSEKALTVAEAMRVPLPPVPHQIIERGSSPASARMLSDVQGTQIQPGQLTIAAQITMIYLLHT